MKNIKKFKDYIKENIINNYTWDEINNFVDELEGKNVSFYSGNKNYTEIINDIELTPDEEDSRDKNATYHGDIWFNDKKINLTKEIKIIE